MKPIVRTERSETPVMFLQVRGEPEQIKKAWDELERLLDQLDRRGTRFVSAGRSANRVESP